MDQMLDAGFYLPAIGFAFRRGGRGYSILKGSYPYLSSIQYLANCGINDRFQLVVQSSEFKVQG